MEMNQYQYESAKTRLKTANQDYALLGLAGEVGELYSLVAKAIRDDDGKVCTMSVKKELGDCLWFIAAIALDYGFTLEEVAVANLQKLQKRKKNNTLTGSGDER